MTGPVPIHNAIPVSITEVEIAPARVSRRSMTIYNDATTDLYVKYGTGVTVNSFLLKIPPGFYGRMPWGSVYAGAVFGLWSGASAGKFAQVTELIG